MRNFVLYILLFSSTIVFAQPDNDECRFATFIESVDGYCSSVGEFSNDGATSDPSFSNTCFGGFENGVWFSFVPREPAVAIQVFSSGTTGSLRFPKIFLFASCNEFVECSPGKDASSDEMVYNGLIIGQVYYIMIESERGAEGNFQLCIDDFIAPKSPESDCGDAVVLCDKSAFRIENLNSAGDDPNEVAGSCLDNQNGPDEFASTWYTWTCEQSGTLTFELTPNNTGIDAVTADLDFVIYKLPNGVSDCSGKEIVACMASGANTNGDGSTAPLAQWASCNGPTGLRVGETDTEEAPGCQGASNNYIAPLNMIAGECYALIVNNFSRNGQGFQIEFGGTGTFLGPQPDFDLSAVQAFECDKTIIFNNLSFSDTDSIISYQWNFGAGASQFFGDGPGPHDIVYESFGEKIAALTVETLRGCQVTKILEFFVDPCCADTSNLAVSANIIDANCNGENSGQISGTGSRGAPQYQFSLDGVNFQPNPRFPNLVAGDYQIFIQDIKGCVNATTVSIDEPPPLIVTAVGDTTIDLGFSTPISATHSPPGSNVTYTWIPPDGLSCENCPDPISTAPINTNYIVQIEDEAGCLAFDTITIRVNTNYQIFTPNIFSPDENGINDNFPIYGNIAAAGIEDIVIYDRWGNQVYRSNSMEINNPTSGWDGKFRDKYVNPGVFTWIAKVRFIDNNLETFTGDITVIR